MSSGDLASISDQDDVWREDKIEIMGRLMEDHPDINPLVSNYREFHPDGREKTGPNRNDGKLMYVRTRSNLLLVDSPGCTHCFRRSLFDMARPYWFDRYPHDALLWRTASMTDMTGRCSISMNAASD